MDTHVTFRHVEPTEAIKRYVEDKAQKLEKYLLQGSSRLNIIFSMDRFMHRVDLTLFEKQHVFKAEGATNDMYASVDLAMHELEQQLRKFKEKVKKHKNVFTTDEAKLSEAADVFDQRLTRVRQKHRSWKPKNKRLLKKKTA